MDLKGLQSAFQKTADKAAADKAAATGDAAGKNGNEGAGGAASGGADAGGGAAGGNAGGADAGAAGGADAGGAGAGAAGGDNAGGADAGQGGSATEGQLSKLFKEKYNLDLSDDEILARIKGANGEGGAAGSGGSATPALVPVDAEITDDEIVKTFEAHRYTREDYTKIQNALKLDDFTLVKDAYKAKMLEKFPNLSDESLDAMLKQKFFISDQDGYFTAEEKAIGELALKEEATALREKQAVLVDNAKEVIKNQRKIAASTAAYNSEVDSFISKMPKKLSIKMGKSGTVELGEFPVNLEDSTIQNMAAIMKNPAKFAEKFSSADGKIDLQKLSNILVQVELGEQIQKSIASHYHGVGVSEMEKRLQTHPDLNNAGGANGEQNDLAKSRREAEEFNARQISKNANSRR